MTGIFQKGVRKNALLPILLSLILPPIGIYRSGDFSVLSSSEFVFRWFGASLLIFFMWVVIRQLNQKLKEHPIIRFIIVLLFLGALVSLLALFSGVEMTYERSLRISFTGLLIFTVQYIFKVQKENALLQLEKQELLSENYKSQLQVLRNQIDPHFLFNSLNTLKAMVRQQHPSSEKFITNLSDFYRQSLKHNSNSTIILGEEVGMLRSYLFLMTQRNEKAVQIKWKVDEESASLMVPTLSLQTVIENCFKHNSATTNKPLKIEVKNEGADYISVRNNLRPKIEMPDSGGSGLESLKRRYTLLGYPDAVKIEKSSDSFTVKLKLIS